MRFFVLFALALVLLLVSQPYATADSTNTGSHRVVEEYIILGGKLINGVNTHELAAGGTSVPTNTIPLYNTKAHSLSVKWTAADPAAEFKLVLQHRSRWGDWIPFNPAIEFTFSGASGAETRAIIPPVASEVRLLRTSDSSHTTTVVAATVNRF